MNFSSLPCLYFHKARSQANTPSINVESWSICLTCDQRLPGLRRWQGYVAAINSRLALGTRLVSGPYAGFFHQGAVGLYAEKVPNIQRIINMTF
jgi:hypothetical protein